jgi:hypothetical protein
MMLWFDFLVRTSTRFPLLPPQWRIIGAWAKQMQARALGMLDFALLSSPRMARKSLRPHLNQIRTWTRQGRTDAWVAHQLEVTVQQIASFKRESGLLEEEPGAAEAADLGEEIDLRAEDDALIAAELEAAEEARREAQEAAAAEAERLAAEDAERGEEEEETAVPKRRARRGARSRRKASDGPLEGTFDHGEEGYGLWLDPAVADDPIYAEYWAGHRPVAVTIEEDQIVIRRSE